MAKKPKRSKMGNRRTFIDGRWFDSKAEANYYLHLITLFRAGKIRSLVYQPTYSIPTGVYTADFFYVVVDTLEEVICDVKGVATEPCKLRLKQMANLGKLVTLITKKSHPQLWK